MRVRSMSTLALGLLLALTACSGGGETKGSPDGSAQQPGAAPSATGPAYSQYADFPGQELIYTDGVMPVGLKLKVVETAWLTELAGKPASIGSHYFALYMVGTPEVADRGVDNALVDPGNVGLRFGTGNDCKRDNIGRRKNPDESMCHDNAWIATFFEDVRYQDWRTYDWQESLYTGYPIEKGQFMASVLAFVVPDSYTPTAGPEFCAPKDAPLLQTYTNCVAVPLPKEARV